METLLLPEGFDYSILLTSVDILLVAYLVYRGLLIVRGTRAAPMLGGLTIVVLLYFLATNLGLLTLAWVLGKFLSSIILVIVVIFQDEIRKTLTKVGLQPVFHRASKPLVDKTVEDITLACTRLSKGKIGGLIVIQREVGLADLMEESVLLDALVNRKLLISIFSKDSPLHDGAVLIVGDRIKSAGCVLPLSFNPDLDPNLGTRHRAALGLSERSDAFIIVVSEENGAISIAREGRLMRNLDASLLRDSLHRFIVSAPAEEEA
jgi:diadenylate cyclase